MRQLSDPAQLPVVPRPREGERLVSWLTRLAALYGMTPPALLDRLALGNRGIFELEWRLGAGEGAVLAARTGLTMAALQAMSFGELAPPARMMIARGERRVCPHCPGDVRLKINALPWSFWCPVHGVRLQAAVAGAPTLPALLSEEQLAALDRDARLGAAQLVAWSRGATASPAVPELVGLLTVRHRQSSPPSLAEQPRLSLAARRDNHGFLNTPIARQALLVVVPEYDRAAPLLTKPVRAGLSALAQGSLLQAYALSVGLGRLVADPVRQVVAVLMASDAAGEQRLRRSLRPWPPALRRQIYARLRRLRVERTATPALPLSTARRSQSHDTASASLMIPHRESQHAA